MKWILVAALLAACGPAAPAPKPTAGPTDQIAAKPLGIIVATVEGTTIEFWCMNDGSVVIYDGQRPPFYAADATCEKP